MRKFYIAQLLLKRQTGIKKVLFAILLSLFCIGKSDAQTYTNFQILGPGSSNPSGCATCGGNNFYIAGVAINGPTPLNFLGNGVGATPDSRHSQEDLTSTSPYNTATVTAGLSSTLIITRGIDYSYGSYFQVYIDWNNDGTFNTSGSELLGISSDIGAGSSGPYSFSYTIPAGTTPGAYRMRVVSLWDGSGGSSPLPNGNGNAQGEAIDFEITVLPGCTSPATGATWGTPNNTTSSQTDISFTRGSGSGVIVLAHDNAAVNAVPSSGTTYSAGTNFTGNSVPFADVANGQSQIGTGNYVIYTATGSNPGATVTTTVTGLTYNHTCYFSVFEYDTTTTCYTLTGATGSVLITSPCTGAPTSGTAATVSTSFCPGGSTTINLTGYTINVSGIVFQWQSSPDGSTWTNVSGGSGATTTSYTTPSLANVTTSNKLYYYQCLVTCQSSATSTPSNTVTITVTPAPVLSVNGASPYSGSMCFAGSPSSQSLAASNAASGSTTYNWSPSTGLNTSSGSSVTATPSTNITYTVTATANSCTATTTASVTVNPSVITFNPAAPSISSGGGVSITATATSTNAGTITYSWTPSTGLSATTGATVSASPAVNTTYTVTATDPNGCSRTGVISVVIKSGTGGQVSCGYSYSSGTGYTSQNVTSLGATGSANYLLDLSGGTPFVFDFNGITYNKFGVNGKGFIWPYVTNSPSVSASLSTPISATSGVDGFIAAWSAPISGSTVGYLVSGTSPNRTLTIQWGATALASTTGGVAFSCQVILYEHNPVGANSDKIQLAYSGQSAHFTSAIAPQIGLRGTANTDYNDRSKASGTSMTSASTTTGSSNAAAVSFGTSSLDLISGGVTFTYTPTVPTPTITPSGQQSVCTSGSGGTGVLLTANTTISSAKYSWENFVTGTAIPGDTNSTFTPNPSAAGTYFYAVVVSNSTGCSRTSVSVPVVATVCCSGVTSLTPTSSSVCGGSTTSITANGITGNNAVLTWWSGPNATGTQYGSANENPLTSAGPGTYYAHVIADCGTPSDASITIGSLVDVGISSITALANPICASTTTILSVGAVGAGVIVNWYSGSGATGTNYGTGTSLPNSGPGTYYAQATGTCGTPVEASFTIDTKTNAGIRSLIPASNPVCTGGTTSITADGVSSADVLTWWTGPNGTGTQLGTTNQNPLTGVGVGTYYAHVVADCGNPADTSVTITSLDCNTSFTVKFFIQGYYLGDGTMSPLLYLLQMPSAVSTDVDTVTIELYSASSPFAFHDSFKGILQTNGNVTGNFVNTVSGGSYYVTIRHRNSITSFSNNPVTLNTGGSYDFTTGAGQTHGNTVLDLGGGVYGIYSGDINQDGSIDVTDKGIMESLLSTFKVGVYNASDLTGDGFVDEDDYRIIINNIPLGIILSTH